MLTDTQLKALMEWIDARIAEKLDDGSSADEGLTTFLKETEARALLFDAFHFIYGEEGNPVVEPVCETCGREMPCEVCGAPDKWIVTTHPRRAYGFAILNDRTNEFWMNASGKQARFWSNRRDAIRSARRLNDGIPL